MNYSLLRKLIEHLENFERDRVGKTDRNDLTHFVAYLNQQLNQQFAEPDFTFEQGESVESLLAQLIAFNYRYAKIHIKKALEASDLLSLDDFSYLVGIWKSGGCTKTEIIEKNIHEKTTGMEIIRRLLSHGHIVQKDDPNDRRSKRLQVTEAGQRALFGSFESMHRASLVIAGNLEPTERMQLLHLLQKLHLFHKPLYLNERDTDLQELLLKLNGNPES